MSKVLVPLANGFEEIEAMSIVDVLSRAGVEVVVAGLDGLEVEGVNTKLKVMANCLLADVDVDSLDMIALPGGLPGAELLAKSEKLKSIIKALHVKNKNIAAICAAPWVLKEAGVLDGKKHTNYPNFEKFTGVEGYIDDQDVVIDGNIITSRGPATAMSFALEIVKILEGEEVYTQVKNGLLA